MKRGALDLLPWYIGLAWAALGRKQGDPRPQPDELMQRAASELFRLSPGVWALLELSRKYPAEFEALYAAQIEEARQRYGGTLEDWTREPRLPDETAPEEEPAP